jgi:hypothetical protein
VPPPNEEQRRARPAELLTLLEGLPAHETAVWQDEVEIHTNPKIGRMWTLKGRQATVQTPGTNKKSHLSGSIHWRTGQVWVTEVAPKQGRDGALFIKHLEDPRRRLRRYKKIHVICDNAGFHTSHQVIQHLWGHEGRIEAHLLPSYSPDYNPIERVWRHLLILDSTAVRAHPCAAGAKKNGTAPAARPSRPSDAAGAASARRSTPAATGSVTRSS